MTDPKLQTPVASVRWWPAGVILGVCIPALVVTQGMGRSLSGRPLLLDILVLFLLMVIGLFVWLTCFSRLRRRTQGKVLLAVLGATTVLCLLVRIEGFAGDTRVLFAWRWAPTVQSRLDERLDQQPGGMETTRTVTTMTATTTSIILEARPGRDWPGFRGVDRRGEVEGMTLEANWDQRPPELLWKMPVGRGWSSFAVAGDYCVTQEQRGEMESVVCYELTTGRECWSHGSTARFHETLGGDGPRATPTVRDGMVYSLGATGILDCLDGADGTSVWSTNILVDAKVENVDYGMAGSPLVTDRLVIVSPGGKEASMVAYDRSSGQRVWAAGDSEAGYCSPMLVVLGGVRQAVILNAKGLFSHEVETGRILWQFDWPAPEQNNNVCQPLFLGPLDEKNAEESREESQEESEEEGTEETNGHLAARSQSPFSAEGVVISSGYGRGATLLAVRREGEVSASVTFSVEEVWHSRHLKAKFSSVATFEGFLFGLDEGILVCVDARTGRRRWKQGRLGHGQLLRVGSLLLVQAESGEVVLVDASPEGYRERARFAALVDRTWNHPVLLDGLLLVRSDRTAACFGL